MPMTLRQNSNLSHLARISLCAIIDQDAKEAERDCSSEIIGVKKIDAGEETSFEFSEWRLSTNSFRERLSIIYRPPYSSQHPVTLNTFMDEFATYLEYIILVPEPLILTGDLNIHVNDTNDPNACEFLDLLVSMGLKQHVKGSTHEGGHTWIWSSPGNTMMSSRVRQSLTGS